MANAFSFLKFFAILLTVSRGGSPEAVPGGTNSHCDVELADIRNKLDAVLYILEQHFVTDFSHSSKPAPHYPSKDSGYNTNHGSYSVNNGHNKGGYDTGTYNIGGNAIPNYGKQIKSIDAGKGASKASDSDAYLNVETEVDTSAYKDGYGYNGATAIKDQYAAKQGLNKEEGYLEAQADEVSFNEDFSGTRINNSVAALTRNVVRQEQDTAVRFTNNYDKENHEGDYKGSEIDIAYKDQNIRGGFKDDETKVKYDASAYQGWNGEGKGYANGDHYGKEYKDYGDNDYDTRNYNAYGDGGYVNGDSGHSYGGYDKYGGSKKDDIVLAPKDGFKKSGFGVTHGHTNEHGDRNKDDHSFGSEYGDKLDYASQQTNEDSVGLAAAQSSSNVWNEGNYQDVNAVGHNKAANYKGDYKKNTETHEADYKFINRESLEEIGTNQRPASLIINDNEYSYSGSNKKYGAAADTKYGKYTDAEYAKKASHNKEAQAYDGATLDSGKQQEAELRKARAADQNKFQSHNAYKSRNPYQKNSYF